MKNKREMTAREHLRVLEGWGWVQVRGNVVTFWDFSDWDEVPQVWSDYQTFCRRNGYEVRVVERR